MAGANTAELASASKEVVQISRAQMGQFCGNVLELLDGREISAIRQSAAQNGQAGPVPGPVGLEPLRGAGEELGEGDLSRFCKLRRFFRIPHNNLNRLRARRWEGSRQLGRRRGGRLLRLRGVRGAQRRAAAPVAVAPEPRGEVVRLSLIHI